MIGISAHNRMKAERKKVELDGMDTETSVSYGTIHIQLILPRNI
jgi:hypothetical protein